jgi:hypothetical protein
LKTTYTEEAIADVVEAITYLNERNPTAAVNLDAENVAFQYFHGPVEIGPNGSLQGALAFAYNLTPHRSEFNLMATTIAVTDQLTDTKRTFSVQKPLEPWFKSHVKIVKPTPATK